MERLVVSIDLRKDTDDVRTMLKDAVRSYAALHRAAETGELHPPVTRIDLLFSLGDSESTPWVHLSFDTKPGGEPDGDPTHPDFATLQREGWLSAVQAVCDGHEVIVERTDGKSRSCGDADFTREIGESLVSALLNGRAGGLFADLPRAGRCELGVEDPTTGEFGWPRFEDRGQQNLV
jgi:hypothetical protein